MNLRFAIGRDRTGRTVWAIWGLCLGLVLVTGPEGTCVRQAHAARMRSNIGVKSTAGISLATLSSRVAASRGVGQSTALITSGNLSTASSRTSTSTSSLFPSNLTDSITRSAFVRDFRSLFALESGKFVNWNQQTLKRLANDLGIKAPSNVTSRLRTTRPVYGAQVIGTTSDTTGTVLAAPVPEPGTWVLFSMTLMGLLFRRRLAHS